jgi:hypothetical protein
MEEEVDSVLEKSLESSQEEEETNFYDNDKMVDYPIKSSGLSIKDELLRKLEVNKIKI